MIRQANKKDIQVICRLSFQYKKMIKRETQEFLFQRLDKRTGQFYLKTLTKQGECLFVFVVQDIVVGYVYASIQTKPDDLTPAPYVEINELVVDQRHRSKGIGTSLIESVEKWAKEKRISIVQLSVQEFNVGARHLYEKLGYQSIEIKMQKRLV